MPPKVALSVQPAGAGVPAATPAGESAPVTAASWLSELLQFASVTLQFGLLVLVIRTYEIEGAAFGDMLALAWGAFVVHHWLPMGLRLPWFVGLSLWSIKVAAGGTVAMTVTVVGVLLIGICHLPIRFAARIALLLLAAGLLAGLRAEWIVAPINPAAWIILGSMFMFRTIAYLYDLYHRSAAFSLFRSLAYFFMLPNARFFLFPLVDYKVFCQTYYNDSPMGIYQSGLRWMLRGVLHLLLYRLIYRYALLSPSEVVDLGGVLQFMVTTYLMYLKISGQFHLIIGLLHMFGFNLPETHHLYLLSSSFTDFWRRINIYWKDFISKVFFYPAYFRLKRLGPTWAMALATAGAFFATWLLHSYQWFWLRGSIELTWQDACFWWSLAGLVLVNALYEAKRGRRRTLAQPRRTLRSELRRALATIGTFAVICTLWTIWYSKSADELVRLAAAATRVSILDVCLLLLLMGVIGVASVLFGHSSSERTEGATPTATLRSPRAFWNSAGRVAVAAGALLALAFIDEFQPLKQTTFTQVVADLQGEQLNRIDREDLRRGYYEDLEPRRFDRRLAFLAGVKPRDWLGSLDSIERQSRAAQRRILLPNRTARFKGCIVSTNRWGIRDRDYERIPPPGTYRIVLLGSSHEFGDGVGDRETYENVCEDLLCREGEPDRRYEMLNFAVRGQTIIECLVALVTNAFDFQPDLVMWVANGSEFQQTDGYLDWCDTNRINLPFSGLSDVLREHRHGRRGASTPHDSIGDQRTGAAIRWGVAYLARECQRRGVRIAMCFRPCVGVFGKDDIAADQRHKRAFAALAQSFSIPFLDLSNAFTQITNRAALVVDSSDDHTNALGHRLLAEELYRKLHDEQGRFLFDKPPPGKTD